MSLLSILKLYDLMLMAVKYQVRVYTVGVHISFMCVSTGGRNVLCTELYFMFLQWNLSIKDTLGL